MTPDLQPQIYHSNPRINLITLLKDLFSRWLIIISITAFFTFVGIYYAIQIPSKYSTTSSFNLPLEENNSNLNNVQSFTNQDIFEKFLSLITSKEFQIKVFSEGNYVEIFNQNNSRIDNVKTYVATKITSIELMRPPRDRLSQSLNFLDSPPYQIFMKGDNPDAIMQYINDLVNTANTQTVSMLNSDIHIKFNHLLELLYRERELSLQKAKTDRLNKIIRLEEARKQKIQDINLEIESQRLYGKLNRINEIQLLKDSAEMASSFRIDNNNIEGIEDSKGSPNINYSNFVATNQQIEFLSGIPNWYLLDAKTLLEKINLLEKAFSNKISLLEGVTNDDFYLPSLTLLKSQLIIAEAGNEIEILKARTDDSAFLATISQLDFSITELKGINLDELKINTSIHLVNSANFAKEKEVNIPFIVALFANAGLLFSILLSLSLDAFKRESELQPQ